MQLYSTNQNTQIFPNYQQNITLDLSMSALASTAQIEPHDEMSSLDTPPDSPLREKFIAKDLAHLHHIPHPPGFEPNEPQDAEDGSLTHKQAGQPDTDTPKIPAKPARLGSFNAQSNPQTVLHSSRLQHQGQQVCLDDEQTLDPREPCYHRHETIYRREIQDGEPVETITQTCEVAGVNPRSRRRIEEYRVSPDGAKQVTRSTSDEARREDDDEAEDEEEFAGLFV